MLGQLSILLTALVGALAGTAGFALLVSGRQARRMTLLLTRLARADNPDDLVDHRGIHDRALRASLDTLAARLALTWRLATIDQLTGVLSRQALLARLADELDRAGRYGRVVSIVLVDLDHFKRVNDAFGHAAGDAVLRSVACVIAANVRAVDAVGRYGGEEFMLILPETDVEDAAAIAEKLRRIVATTLIGAGAGNDLTMTISAGIAGSAGGRLHVDSLIHAADDALYAAKSLGRDQIQIHQEVSNDTLIARASIDPAAREQASAVGRSAARAATEVLIDVLSSRDGSVTEPSTMIAEAAATVARSIGLPALEVERIRAAGLLHDLGNLAVPEDILSYPGALGGADWRVVTEHPKVGQIILEQAGALRDAGNIVLHHHEWFDGRGYPHGLTGEEIPIGARIVAVIDAYEAMVAGRPYRPAIAHEDAIAELRRHAGTQFDPGVVEAFAALFGREGPWLLGQPGLLPVAPSRTGVGDGLVGPAAEGIAPRRGAKRRRRPAVGRGRDDPIPTYPEDRPTESIAVRRS